MKIKCMIFLKELGFQNQEKLRFIKKLKVAVNWCSSTATTSRASSTAASATGPELWSGWRTGVRGPSPPGKMEKFRWSFYVVLEWQLPVLDWFDWHFKASVHFTQSSAINKSQWHRKIPQKAFREWRKSNLGLLGEKQETMSISCVCHLIH